MKSIPIERLGYLAALWLCGTLALAATTWVCFQFQLNLATTSLAYLIVIVLLSLLDSLISSIVLSVVAVALLNYFFVEPLFTLQVEYAQDSAALIVFVITSIVITSLVRCVRNLANTQREQARLLDLTRDTIIVRGMDDAITYWNRGAEEFYGWSANEAVGRIAQDLLRTAFPTPLETIKEALLRDGRWEGELVNTTRNNERLTVASRWALQRDAGGHPVCTLETNNDITERRRAEDLMRRSQAAYLAEAQKLSRTGSFGWNATNGDIFWSEESFRIFGYEPATKPSIDLILQRVHPDDVAAVWQALDQAESGKQNFDIEHRLRMPDGTIR